MKALQILIILLMPNICFGFDANIKRGKDYTTLEIRNLSAKELRLDQKLQSGLKTEMLVLAFSKVRKSEVLLSKTLIKVRYNLWDENYAFQNGANTPKTFSSKEKVLAALKDFDMTILRSDYSKSPQGDYNVVLKILINPIKKEKSKKIKKWLAEKNVSKANGRGGQVGLTSVFNGMVNRVVLNDLNQDIYGAAQTAEYKSTNTLNKKGVK